MEAHFLTRDFAKYIQTLKPVPPPLLSPDAKGLAQPPLSNVNVPWEMFLDLGAGRIGRMDEAGIDMQVLSLYVPPDSNRRIQMFEPKEAMIWAKRVNDDLAAAVTKHSDRFIGLAALPVQSPDDAADELERSVKTLGLKGANITSHAQNEYLDNEKYWVIFETAEKLDVPIYLHPSYPSAAIASALTGYGGILASASYGFAVDVSLHMMRLIMSGLFDKYPRLKVILGHMGEGLPFWFTRMDMQWRRRATTPPIKRRPSEYIKTQCTMNTSGMFYVPALMCAYMGMGAEKIAFGSDYPIEDVWEALRFMKETQLSAAEKEQIYHGNAEALFKL